MSKFFCCLCAAIDDDYTYFLFQMCFYYTQTLPIFILMNFNKN